MTIGQGAGVGKQGSALGAAGQQIMAASVRSTGSGKHPVSFKAFVDDLEVRTISIYRENSNVK